MRVGWLAVLFVAACADAGTGVTPTDAPPGGDDSGSGGGVNPPECPAGQFATNVETGALTCTSPDPLTQQALADRCSAYLGWRDGCDACTTAPSKWGRASTASCSPGVGTNNTCTMPTLGADVVHLFGLDLDGDMDGNDKLHAGLHCTADTTTGGVVPCPPGQLVNGRNGVAWLCTSFAKTVVSYVQDNCSVYLGWQDNCDGCITAPAKWGYTSPTACMNGAGADNTCNMPAALGNESVRLFGLNPDGDVDGNDKLHVALRCTQPAAESTTQQAMCPPGQFLAARTTDGALRCDSAFPAIAQYFAAHCSLYFGWHDSCDGCITPPTKWGKVRVDSCTNGAGGDNTCSKFTLGGAIDMFGLSPDGNVDENDVLYVGFRCD